LNGGVSGRAGEDDHPDTREIARRMRALAAYGNLHANEAARIVGVSVAHWARLTDRKGGEIARATDEQQRQLADHVGVPYTFFEIDFARLSELATDSEVMPLDPALVRLAESILYEDARRRGLQTAAEASHHLARRRGQRRDEDRS
jgi:hypothetical protein